MMGVILDRLLSWSAMVFYSLVVRTPPRLEEGIVGPLRARANDALSNRPLPSAQNRRLAGAAVLCHRRLAS